MKKLSPFLLCLIFTACNVQNAPVYDEETAVYEFFNADKSDSVFLERPVSATVTDGNGSATIEYKECKVALSYDVAEWPDADQMTDGDFTFQSVFGEKGEPQKYRGISAGVSLSIDWNISNCMPFVDSLTRSLSDVPMYHNKEYGFSVKLFEGWEYEKLPEGIVLKKTVSPELPKNFDDLKDAEKIPYEPFPVEIAFLAQDSPYQELSELIIEKYPGYSVEFATLGDVYGVKVGEQQEKLSINHFYFMSEDHKTLYEANIKIWNIHYNEFAATFEGIVATVKLF